MLNHEYDYRPNWTTRKFCYQLIITLTKFVIYNALFFFFNSKQKKFHFFFASGEKKNHLSARVMERTVQLVKQDVSCPIKLSY